MSILTCVAHAKTIFLKIGSEGNLNGESKPGRLLSLIVDVDGDVEGSLKAQPFTAENVHVK